MTSRLSPEQARARAVQTGSVAIGADAARVSKFLSAVRRAAPPVGTSGSTPASSPGSTSGNSANGTKNATRLEQRVASPLLCTMPPTSCAGSPAVSTSICTAGERHAAQRAFAQRVVAKCARAAARLAQRHVRGASASIAFPQSVDGSDAITLQLSRNPAGWRIDVVGAQTNVSRAIRDAESDLVEAFAQRGLGPIEVRV